MKWTTTQLIAAGALGVLMTLISIPGSLIAVAVGIPGAGVILNGIVLPLFAVFSLLLIRNFGTAAIVGGIYGFLILPLPIGGPPGFLAKSFLWLIVGLILDTLWAFSPRKGKLAVLLTSGFGSLAAFVLFITMLLFFNVPGGEKFASFAKSPIVALVIILWGTAGGFAGWLIYKKLENTSVVKRIQAAK